MLDKLTELLVAAGPWGILCAVLLLSNAAMARVCVVLFGMIVKIQDERRESEKSWQTALNERAIASEELRKDRERINDKIDQAVSDRERLAGKMDRVIELLLKGH